MRENVARCACGFFFMSLLLLIFSFWRSRYSKQLAVNHALLEMLLFSQTQMLL